MHLKQLLRNVLTWVLLLTITYTSCENIDYAEKLMEKYGSEGRLTTAQLKDLIDGVTKGDESEPISSNSSEKCLAPADIFALHSLLPNGSADVSQLSSMSPAIIYQIRNTGCVEEVHGRRVSHAEVWGYGFLSVTIINLCALMGLAFYPVMHKSFYNTLLMYMVALAVGTLAGSSILFLIPEAFGLTTEEHPLTEGYVWKSTTIMGGIYLFFLVERLLKIITTRFKTSRSKDGSGAGGDDNTVHVSSVKTHSHHMADTNHMTFETVPPGSSIHDSASSQHLMPRVPDITIQASNGDAKMAADQHVLVTIKPVAWMVIVGDGLHNFIDGLSIGAAFTESKLAGASISMAVFCEELPHELGDFAILLNSGMTMRQALSYNFLSACMCYGGLVIGIIVGELSEGAYWIFAVAGGMFLYISLVDMLPEVNHAADEEEQKHGRVWVPFFIQNAGILSGYAIMIILAYFGGQIDFEGW